MGDERYLIVGGAGYFGSRLAEALMTDASVVITQRAPRAIRTEWIARAGLQSVDFDSAVHTELTVAGEFDAVINLAMPGAVEAARDPEGSRARGLGAAGACIRLLKQGRAARMIHFSTFHTYGAPGRTAYSEDDVPEPIHPYGRIHLEVERAILENDRAVVVRPSNLVGAPAHADLGDQMKLLFLDLCRQAADGAIELKNDGLSYRDFLAFDDAIAAVRLLLKTKSYEHRLINIARGESLRLDVIAHLVQQAAANAPTLAFGTGTDAFRTPFTVCVARLQALGWQQHAPLSDAAAEIVRFFQSSK